MSRVIGVTAVIVVLCSAHSAFAQEQGWGNQQQEGGTGTGGGEEGWGQQNDTTTTTTTPPPEEGTDGWGTPQAPQQNDTESATGGTQQPGWNTQQTTTTTQQTTTQPPPTPTTTTTAPTTTESQELTGDRFRMANRVALGGHTHMSGAFLAAYDGIPEASNDTNSPWLNLSFMYTISPLLTIDIFAGFTVGVHSYIGNGDESVTGHRVAGDKVTNFEFALGPRLQFTIHSGERTRLYSGVGAALLINSHNSSREDEDEGVCPGTGCGGWDSYGFALGAPIGFEYRFRNAPHLALSLELNFHFVFQNVGMRFEDPDNQPTVVSQAEFNQIIVGIGNPKNPDAFDFVNLLTFLTFGFHYML